jgi:hypothetical protein
MKRNLHHTLTSKLAYHRVLILALITCLGWQQAIAQYTVLAVRGEANLLKPDGKSVMELGLGDVLPKTAKLRIGSSGSVLVWSDNNLQEVTSNHDGQALNSLPITSNLPSPVFLAEPTIKYLANRNESPIYSIKDRLALQYSISNYPLDSINGFMLNLSVKYGGKNNIKKRCSTWGDSVVIDRSAMALPSFGAYGGPGQLFYFTKENTFYKLLGNVVLLDKSFVKSSLEPLKGLFGQLPPATQKQRLTQYIMWCYPTLLQVDCQILVNEWVAETTKRVNISRKKAK